MKNNQHKKIDIYADSIIPATFKLVLPMVFMQVASWALIYFDTLFISMIDKQSTSIITAAGLVTPVYNMFYAISVGIWIGVSSIIARGIGTNNKEIIDKTAVSGILICEVLSVFSIIIVLIFGNNIIQFFAGAKLTAETIRYANEYLLTLLPGMILLLFVHVLDGILSGEGLTKYIGPGWAMVNIINILLDPVFIFLLKMDVKGAGIASSISMVFLFIYFSLIFIKKKNNIPVKWNIFKANVNLIKKISGMGSFTFLIIISNSVSAIILNKLISSISQTFLNSYILVTRINQVILIPAIALTGVTTAMIGQNYGRGLFERVKKIFYTHILLVSGVCLICVCVYMIFAPVIIKIFTSVPDVLNAGVRQVYITAFALLGVAGTTVITYSFQATGKALPGLLFTLIRLFIIIIPLSLLSVYVFKTGMSGIYVSIIVSSWVSFLFAFIWGRSHINRLDRREIS